MQSLLTEWEALCSRSPALRFVDIGLRGFGQVMFQDNPLTGILFLAAIAWGSVRRWCSACAARRRSLAWSLRRLPRIWLDADKTTLRARSLRI